MDDLVKQAMAKWPNVPDCYGWLGLDERGDWYMRDDHVQALGGFKVAKGSKLTHEKLVAFINRNYACTSDGQWYFQNGPQRVFVELAATPYVLRLFKAEDGSVELKTHTELHAIYQSCELDELGRLFVSTEHGRSLVHSQDVPIAADLIECGSWNLLT